MVLVVELLTPHENDSLRAAALRPFQVKGYERRRMTGNAPNYSGVLPAVNLIYTSDKHKVYSTLSSFTCFSSVHELSRELASKF